MDLRPKSLEEILVAPGVKGKEVMNISKDGFNDSTIMSIIFNQKQGLQDPFYVLDLGVVVSLMEKWSHSFPNIKPFYAVKCNPNPTLLGTLAALGAGFDCASQAEIEQVLALGVSPDRIVFANPCKAEAHIKYAAHVGVMLTTFDSREEIEKIRRWHPKCALLLRLKVSDESGAKYPLGSKFGALPEEVRPLLQAAHEAGLEVVGVSFHVGSGAAHSRGFSSTIAAAKEVFDTAVQLDMPQMHILNIGGGFTVGKQFNDAAVTVKASLQANFPNEHGVLTLMSEPGQFFAQTPFTLVTNIIGKRVRNELREYWINDGIFGSLMFILLEHAIVLATPLACNSNPANPTCTGLRTYSSTVFGPTCDALDTVLTSYQLPELEVNDWLVFPNMGAYTSCLGTNFNGFNTSAITTHIVCSTPSHKQA